MCEEREIHSLPAFFLVVSYWTICYSPKAYYQNNKNKIIFIRNCTDAPKKKEKTLFETFFFFFFLKKGITLFETFLENMAFPVFNLSKKWIIFWYFSIVSCGIYITRISVKRSLNNIWNSCVLYNNRINIYIVVNLQN